jgi:hypothetical protein
VKTEANKAAVTVGVADQIRLLRSSSRPFPKSKDVVDQLRQFSKEYHITHIRGSLHGFADLLMMREGWEETGASIFIPAKAFYSF